MRFFRQLLPRGLSDIVAILFYCEPLILAARDLYRVQLAAHAQVCAELPERPSSIIDRLALSETTPPSPRPPSPSALALI